MKYQTGGLAAAADPDVREDIDPATGYLGLLASQYTTSPEAQDRAREILDDLMAEGAFEQEEELLERFKETAEQSRQALKEARERLLADKFDPRQKWLAAAQAFGAPTRTGQFGETLGSVAGALRGPLAEEAEFNRQRDQGVLGIDQQLAGVDENLLMNEFKLAQLRRQQMTDLGQEALKTLGKASTGRPPTPTPGVKSRDQKMATIANDWITKDASDAYKMIAELNEAVDIMRESDDISGPYMGILPKWARDIAFPESGNVQDLVENTAQRSLRAILGAQFAQKEGEMLLARTFNPRQGS